jgi:predicted patatin/cPLA2 family phospholipase
VPVPSSYDVLVLSAGGQYGAYGSGFLQGWGNRADLRPNRGDIDMVTGVSTGAMMASYAYLGSSNDPAVRAKYDALLKNQYTTLRDEDVFRKRQPVEYLWANSLFDSAPLQDRIRELITDELLDEILAEETRSKRLLLVGAVNADSGGFEHFDLIAIAGDRSHDRRTCYASAILASAAIPLAFNPIFINNRMYLDGGARHHTFFLTQVAEALPGAAKNVFGILHGDLSVPQQETPNNLVGVVSRTSTIATDQLMLDSAYYVDAEARRLGYGAHWTAAKDTGCPVGSNDDMFSPALGLCLWENGLGRARDEGNPWKTLRQLTQP